VSGLTMRRGACPNAESSITVCDRPEHASNIRKVRCDICVFEDYEDYIESRLLNATHLPAIIKKKALSVNIKVQRVHILRGMRKLCQTS
jgi:hypothetical protein